VTLSGTVAPEDAPLHQFDDDEGDGQHEDDDQYHALCGLKSSGEPHDSGQSQNKSYED